MKNFNIKLIDRNNEYLSTLKNNYSKASELISNNEIEVSKISELIDKNLLKSENAKELFLKQLQEGQFKNKLKDLNEIIFKYFIKIIYFKRIFFELDIDNEQFLNDFLRDLIDIHFYEEYLYELNHDKYDLLMNKLTNYFENNCKSNSLTSTSYSRENESAHFDKTKRCYTSNLESREIFNIIKEINRNFIPFTEDKKFLTIFNLLTFDKSGDFKSTIKYLSHINDPYFIFHIISRFSNNLDFLLLLLQNERKDLIIWGLIELYDYCEKLENEFLYYVRENINNIIQSNDFSLLEKLINEKDSNSKELNNIFETTIKNLYKDKPESEVILLFSDYLNCYLKYKTNNYRGNPYLLKSIDIFYICVLGRLIELLKNEDLLFFLKNNLSFDKNNAMFYGCLVLNLKKHGYGDKIIEEVSTKYINDFIESIFSNQHFTEFGFQYDYQQQYTNGIIDIIVTNLISNETEQEIFKLLEMKLNEIITNNKDTFLKIKFSEDIHKENLRYFVSVILQIIIALYKEGKKISIEFVHKLISNFNIVLLQNESFFIPNYFLWMLFAEISKYNEIFKEYYLKRITDIESLISALYIFPDIITEEMYIKSTKNREFDLKSAKHYELSYLFWILYNSDKKNELIISVYENLDENEQQKYNDIYLSRIGQKDIKIINIIEFVNKSFLTLPMQYINHFLSYWEKKFKTTSKDEIIELFKNLLNMN
jgi:hypothetical protein